MDPDLKREASSSKVNSKEIYFAIAFSEKLQFRDTGTLSTWSSLSEDVPKLSVLDSRHPENNAYKVVKKLGTVIF